MCWMSIRCGGFIARGSDLVDGWRGPRSDWASGSDGHSESLPELYEIKVSGFNHPAQNIQIEFGLLMNGEVAKSRHAAKGFGEVGVYQSRPLQESERSGTALRHTQPPFGHDMHRHVNRGLAGALDVEGEGIQMGEIVKIRARVECSAR
jgi:hypothetical protein